MAKSDIRCIRPRKIGVAALAYPLLLIIAGAITDAARAQGAGWTPEQEQTLAAGDPEQGKALADKCSRCHGEAGVSDDDEVPHLAGQNPRYIFKQLRDFAADAREGGRMNKTARKLSEADMANLAVMFSAMSLPPMADQPVPPAPSLVTDGDPGRKLTACAECHGADGRGKSADYDAPALTGMPYDYFVASMQAFRDGSRSNDLDGVMRAAAQATTEPEIQALAEYYLALGKRQRLPPN
jgi:cytochrome c553